MHGRETVRRKLSDPIDAQVYGVVRGAADLGRFKLAAGFEPYVEVRLG
jgi:hypothetical protein